MMRTDNVGLYIHIPFCVRKCNYCDFCSYPIANALWREKYIEALCNELSSYKDMKIGVDTLFFGGGTPSLLSPSEFYKIISTIQNSFSLSKESEITMEINPGTVTKENLGFYIASGVNRVSIGLQSIHKNELKKLGRMHNDVDFYKCYDLVRSLGISNVNLDLMYGIPEQTHESFTKTLEKIITLSPEHLSIYGLIVEEETVFGKMGDRLVLPSEDEEFDMYFAACNMLCDVGFSHYEISNYSLVGKECRHNLKYWHNESYIGCGVAAYSYYKGLRFGNSSDINEYLSVEREKYKCIEKPINKKDEAYEYVMLGLRLSEGISLLDYKSKFGEEFINSERFSILGDYQELGYLNFDDKKLWLTEKGFYISNRILTDIL